MELFFSCPMDSGRVFLAGFLLEWVRGICSLGALPKRALVSPTQHWRVGARVGEVSRGPWQRNVWELVLTGRACRADG